MSGDGDLAPAERCACYGIGRRVGYKWLARFVAEGVAGSVDRRRVAKSHPHRMSADIAARPLACRKAHPTWGPRELLAYLERRHPREPWPAASSVGALLKRAGLVRPRRRRPAPEHPGRPTTPMDAPNAVWTTDFKGQSRTGDGVDCYPLTVADGCSRYARATCSRAGGCSRCRRSACAASSSGSSGSTASRRAFGVTTGGRSRRRRWAGSPRSASGGSSSGSRRS